MDEIVLIPDYNDVDDCHVGSSVELLEENFVEFSVFWKADSWEVFPERRDDARHCDIEFLTRLLENLMLDVVVLVVSPKCCNLRIVFD